MLDTSIKVFNILTDDNQIDAAPAVRSYHTGQLTNGTDVAVSLQEFAEGDVGRFLAVADGSTERPFEDTAGFANAFDGLLRDAGGDALLEDAFASVTFLEFDFHACGFNDLERGGNAFGANAVAGDDGYELFSRSSCAN